jgi:hypothetical protein
VIVWGNYDGLLKFAGWRRWKSDTELGNELKAWLQEAGFGVQNLPVLQGNVSFNFSASDPAAGRPVTVTKIPKEPGLTLSSALVLPDDADGSILKGMKENQRIAINEEIGIELTRFGVGFSKVNILNPVTIFYKMLHPDSLNSYQFIERVNIVVRAILLTQLVVMRHVREEKERRAQSATNSE